MGRRKQAAEEPAEPEERSVLAGAVVVVLLLAVVFGVLFAWSDAAGILGVVAACTVAVWWMARRPVPDSSATPPPQRPSCRECRGHELVDVTPLEGQEGMWIYKTAPPGRPNHTHIHLSNKEMTS
ncbi:hypothetical protein [Streptomyces sp. AC512_CC834]|uniref:hypothetical protein n=1 Tax=Streptomyces sp. AC512_CC834 TaxID=2823691 RepID=UPI001C259271|nr:hypothetical protein [Streptomyces sp. AC512_CC834]